MRGSGRSSRILKRRPASLPWIRRTTGQRTRSQVWCRGRDRHGVIQRAAHGPDLVDTLGLAPGQRYVRTLCGRVRLSSDVSEIKLVFSIPPHRPTPNFPPSWNVAPTDTLPVIRYDTKAGERSLDLLRWGLVPYWAKDLKVGFANINAKAEGIETKPAFREAFQRRRCLVPVDNFYEWAKTGTGKQPYAIALADRSLMALAGLWENWKSPEGEWMRSFAIVTTTPNELCARLHNRMPVVLKPEAWPVWLGEEQAEASELKDLLTPIPSDEMTCWPVSARVGNVKNNDASLIEPIAA
jgi:putative SOS response-associated peptidase YedK